MQQHGIEFTSSSFTLPVLKLSGSHLQEIDAQLQQQLNQAPSLFDGMSCVLDLEAVGAGVALAPLLSLVRRARLNPLGIRQADAGHKLQAREAGVPLLTGSRSRSSGAKATRVEQRSIRSGQQLYAEGGDLVIIGSVSAGAEVIADGSIQVLGTLRGKAIAGANGQSDASILCLNQQAELLSIAGHFWLSEQITREYWQKAALARLAQGQLALSPVSL
ncbi:septum site-determining protein MinC [Ferrimonas sediminicola]|uniref:Probable septum site-determining protein MinC n=1 Tax=Ferrimonas sediminicola TaxID=2569538 RepID=A0A4U1BGT1_9GAMM|nr:septum site-determining protein MinC [Ferrimonas sediminicola]TKB50224.1 septum site-determining protein MinC [Ferrimonas sediminicola]